MADIKQIEIIPDSGALGTKLINFGDAPAGLTFSRRHVRPTSPRRTQDGALVTQTLRYNKKEITITLGLWIITLHTYLEALFEAGIGATLRLWYEDSGSSYAETKEFEGSVSFISYDDDGDKNDNSRNINAVFSEV